MILLFACHEAEDVADRVEQWGKVKGKVKRTAADK